MRPSNPRKPSQIVVSKANEPRGGLPDLLRWALRVKQHVDQELAKVGSRHRAMKLVVAVRSHGRVSAGMSRAGRERGAEREQERRKKGKRRRKKVSS